MQPYVFGLPTNRPTIVNGMCSWKRKVFVPLCLRSERPISKTRLLYINIKNHSRQMFTDRLSQDMLLPKPQHFNWHWNRRT